MHEACRSEWCGFDLLDLSGVAGGGRRGYDGMVRIDSVDGARGGRFAGAWAGVLALAAGGVLLLAAPAGAAPAGAEGAAVQEEPAERQPGFLFGRPGNSVGLRINWHRARADSEVHGFLTEFLTLEPRDFDALGVAFDLGFAVTPRLDLRVGLDYVKTPDATSEFREFVGSDGLPIAQDTALSQTDFNASVAFALIPRGRAIGQYAWIPSRVVPYVGAGAGMQRYGLDLIGEFVDQADFSIFEDHLQANGWTPSLHLFGGADIRLLQRLYLAAEVRYLHAADEPGGAFEGFDDIDLSGLRVGAGIRFIF